MFTVFRCAVDKQEGIKLLRIVTEEFNKYKPNLFKQKNERNCNNSCLVCKDNVWWDHYRSMIDFIKMY